MDLLDSQLDEDHVDDQTLCQRAVDGDQDALERLIRKHQPWMYNLAVRLVLSPHDAEDLTQEALIRMMTRLSQFQHRASFKTWVYRIVVNCFLDGQKRPMEQAVSSFQVYGEELKQIPLEEMSPAERAAPEYHLLVEEAKIGCMLGMLLCLNRQQRVAFVLGEVFEVPAPVCAQILEITPQAFRKRLERARRDLSAFMRNQCGLLNESNPCRCAKKTSGFIAAGWVDPNTLKFTGEHLRRLDTLSKKHSPEVDQLFESSVGQLFRTHRLLPAPDFTVRLNQWMQEGRIAALFLLD